MKHQIITIGKGLAYPYLGLKEFSPDVVHLLVTAQTEAMGDRLMKMLPSALEIHVYKVHAYDGLQVMAICRSIQEAYRVGEFSYSLSEGTKIMTSAAFKVAQQYGAFAFYISQRSEVIDLATYAVTPLHAEMSNDEFIRLSDNYLTSYHNLNSLRDTDVEASWAIKEFLETYDREHSRIQKYFSQKFGRELSRLPDTVALEGGLEVRTAAGTLCIEKEGKILLKVEQDNASFLYFEGRWWETLVCHYVKEWSNKQKQGLEMWGSVIFGVGDQPAKVKNEIDIMLNHHQKLMLIECKSGYISQEDIYRTDATRETYGGNISQAILVSYYPLIDALAEKCRDLHIYAFAPEKTSDRYCHLETLPDWLDSIVSEPEV